MKVNVLIPGHLKLTCRKCTRVAGFAADTPEAAAATAKRAGWINDGEQVVCPWCPGTRLKVHDPIGVTVGFGVTHEQIQAAKLKPKQAVILA